MQKMTIIVNWKKSTIKNEKNVFFYTKQRRYIFFEKSDLFEKME